MSTRTVEIQGEDIVRFAGVLSSMTRFRIIKIVSGEKMDISTIAKRLQISEAQVSDEITLLERLGIIKATYERGKRGVRRVCELSIGKIIISLM